jgi:enamine deaminase RidA (YjgF/YER057c/UK114 family)
VADHSSHTAPHTILNPAGWPRPKGFANGILARGEMVFVGGMIGQDRQGRFPDGFVAQMKLALENIAAVLKEAGAAPAHIVRLTWYVRDMDEYLADLPALGAA